jgi:hypothetical protein
MAGGRGQEQGWALFMATRPPAGRKKREHNTKRRTAAKNMRDAKLSYRDYLYLRGAPPDEQPRNKA